MSHNPLPWSLTPENEIVDANGVLVVWGYHEDFGALLEQIEPGNANLIITAANSHYELLGALKGLLPAFSYDADPEKGYVGEVLAAIEAIAKAEPPEVGNPGR